MGEAPDPREIDCPDGDVCKWACDTHETPMAYVEAKGFIDFPTAWKIARRTKPEYHHNECSFNTTGGAILCDCQVLNKSPEYTLTTRQAIAETPTTGLARAEEDDHE